MGSHVFFRFPLSRGDPSDVYNMQLSNEPAEELAKLLIEQSNGAFDLVGFVSGGARRTSIDMSAQLRRVRERGYGSCNQDCTPGLTPPATLRLTLIERLAPQYFYETKQPQRTNFIARHLSFHGNSVGTLSLAYHPTRRGPYEAILDHEHYHHVSPAYAKRFQKPDETEEQYVERLRKELEDKFLELGPDTVIGCQCRFSSRSRRGSG